MFDQADFVPLPGIPETSVQANKNIVGQYGRSTRTANINETLPRESPSPGIPSASSSCHVVQACSMNGNEIAVALSDGRLCHTSISHTNGISPKEESGRTWPEWRAWNSRHGRVLQLTYSPAHDALVTLEHVTTAAAGDQVFLGRYHRRSVSRKRREHLNCEERMKDAWDSCTIPLATSHASMAVCPCRGWAAVCTGSVVNLWAVSQPGSGPSTAWPSGSRAASTGFEHALAVDLAELVGAVGGRVGGDGAARHIALLGNILAVATDYAIFVLRLSFDVKGETPSNRKLPSAGGNVSSETQSLNVSDQTPTIHPSRNTKANPKTLSTKSNLKNSPGEVPSTSKVVTRNDSSIAQGGVSRGNELSAPRGDKPVSSGGSRKGGTKVSKGDHTAHSRGGGGSKEVVVEGTVVDAEHMVLCVMREGSQEASGLRAEGPAPPPPVLRAFDDDWESFGARVEAFTDELYWELETVPTAMDAQCASLPVTGNPAVVESVNGCHVVLARRVGSGEVLKEVRLMPVAPSDEEYQDSRAACPGRSSVSPSPSSSSPLACRLILLTNKGATVCLVTENPIHNPSSTTCWSPVPLSTISPSSSSSRSPPQTRIKSRRAEYHDDRQARGKNTNRGFSEARYSESGADLRFKSGCIPHDNTESGSEEWPLRVFLRFSCRFNHDVIRATIMRSFLIALTAEGLEVWTFPSDSFLVSNHRRGCMLSESGSEGGKPAALSLTPSPRPCLLHVQKLEMSSIMPRSPSGGLVAVEGDRPGVLVFASPFRMTSMDGPSLAFLMWQSRGRPRACNGADEPPMTGDGDHLPGRSSAMSPAPPSPCEDLKGHGTNHDDFLESWHRKCMAWQEGFCQLGEGALAGNGIGGNAHVPPLAIFLQLKTTTEAFRDLAVAEARVPHPRSATVLAAFLAAAEGLHGALTAEALSSWRAAVYGGNLGPCGESDIVEKIQENGSPSVSKCGGGIEGILPSLLQCWKLQHVAMRCASLMASLFLEEAERCAVILASKGVTDRGTAAIVEAYRLACLWLLHSGESIVRSCKRLRDAAEHLVDAANTTRTMGKSMTEASEVTSSVDGGDDARSTESSSWACFMDLQESLSGVMYDTYVLRALGVGDWRADEGTVGPPPLTCAASEGDLGSLDVVLLGLVGHLYERDKKHGLQRPNPRSLIDAEQQSVSLAGSVIRAGRAPWMACSGALSYALHALDQLEQASSPGCSSSGSSGYSITRSSSKSRSNISLSSSSRTSLGGASKRSSGNSRRIKTDSRRGITKAELTVAVPADDIESETRSDGGTPSGRAWIAVARAILAGYSQVASGESASNNLQAATLSTSPMDIAAAIADDAMLQLASEKHPALITARKGGIGPLARALLSAGRARPLVLALVRLTSCEYGSSIGARASFGPHKAKDLLQLTADCFSAALDPLQALGVLGNPGRQVAARLDSLMRASLETTAPGRPRSAFHRPFESSGDRASTQTRVGRERQRSLALDNEALEAAAREFLTRRCAASLSQTNHVDDIEQRLSEALGAPSAWQTSLARKRALYRAILRHLIGAHLDDLRALEAPTAGRSTVSRDADIFPVWKNGLFRKQGGVPTSDCWRREKPGWTDSVVELLAGGSSGSEEGAAEGHLRAIMALVRNISWRSGASSSERGVGSGGMSAEEAFEVVTEAKRRLPAPPPASPASFQDANRRSRDHTVAWGSGRVGTGMRPAPWPWPPQGVPPSAVGALVALAAALPLAKNLTGGVDVMLQITAEVVAAAKAEAAVAAGVAAAAASAGRGGAKKPQGSSTGGGSHAVSDFSTAIVEQVAQAAERTLLLYVSEYCGKDPSLWEAVTSHVRNIAPKADSDAVGGTSMGEGEDDDVWSLRLVNGLLRSCGEELGGADLVRALPVELTLMECLDEVERGLLQEE